MNAPLYKFGAFNDEFSLVIAFVIGLGFGFALERGGFGNARILAAQFYLTNMRVFKVMFSAIVTAMLGLFYLSVMGWVDLSLVYLPDTYIIAQVLGGLILGIGFVIGGYCPGTSVVSFSTGRTDGLVFMLGILAGIFIFGEAFPYITDLFTAGHMGKVTLPEFLNIPYGVIVFAVVVMAVAGFAGAEWVEKKMAEKKGVN